MQSVTKLSSSQFCTFQIIPVGLVDHNAVGHFHNTALNALQLVSCTCQLNQQEEIYHRMNSRFTLSHPDGFHKNLIESGSLAEYNRLTRFACHSSQRTCRGLGRINDFGCTESCSIRVLSPKILPLLRSLLGSIANTASFPPFSSTCKPNTSIEVLFPAPGTPLIPIRTEFPE